ncbi:hypothetical protein B0H13DRAFT_1900873 [Mycena leptocephala]|nr:hypothetical protein B0H13DRAFT_1900873 [Mycena leptocephala]
MQNFIVRGTGAILDTPTECYCSVDLPFKPAETLERIERYRNFSDVHPRRQLRLATAIKQLFGVGIDRKDRDTLLHHILHSKLFSGYAPSQSLHMNTSTAWLDDSDARNNLKATSTVYLKILSSTPADSTLISHAQKLVTQLDVLHPEQHKEPQEKTTAPESVGDYEPSTPYLLGRSSAMVGPSSTKQYLNGLCGTSTRSTAGA